MGRGQVCRRVSGPGRTEGLTARLAAPAWPRVAPRVAAVKKGLAAPNREQIMEVNFIARPPKPCLTGDPSYEPNNDGFGRPRLRRLRRCRDIRLHNGLTDPHGS